MEIIFDGNEWNIEDSSKTILEIAKQHDIFIPAPCHYSKSENGCCNGCLLLIDGKETTACNTLPIEGMNIIFNRDDLIAKREHNLTNFELGITPEIEAACGASEHTGCGDDCSCSGNCGCGSH